jgi:hypothetical protein
MIGKSWFCGFLMVIVLTGGCGESAKKGQMEMEMTGQETKMASRRRR